jgi:Lon protease-like protein
MSDEIPLFPVTEWLIGPVLPLNLVIFRPRFLSHSMQSMEEAQPSRHYALTPQQARDLIGDIQKALEKLDNSATPAQPGHRH